MRTTTMLLLVLALAGCEKGSGPTTTPDEATPDGGGEPEESIPDDEDFEDAGDAEPY